MENRREEGAGEKETMTERAGGQCTFMHRSDTLSLLPNSLGHTDQVVNVGQGNTEVQVPGGVGLIHGLTFGGMRTCI